MRSFKHILSLLLTFSFQAFSTNYIDSTAKWIQSYSWYGVVQTTQCRYEYYFDGDSVISGKYYLKIMQKLDCDFTNYTNDSIGNPITVITHYSDTVFSNFFREENKAFYLYINDSTESKLYNFNVHDYLSFDSITAYTTCYPNNAVLLEHDTVCIGSKMRLSWQVSQSQYQAATLYIEGVGPNSGFNAPICRNGCPECGYGLTYFILDGDTLYHGNCNPEPNAILENTTNAKVGFIYDGNYIRVDNNYLQSVDMLSLQGKLLASFSCHSSKNVMINTSSLAEGFYVIVAHTDTISSVHKIYVSNKQ